MPLTAVHQATEAPALRQALDRHGWNISHAATDLGCHPATLLRAIRRHPELADEYARKSRGRGRPKKRADQ